MADEMAKINIKQLKSVIKHNVLALNKAVMFVGPSGAGKTAGVEEACHEEDCYLHSVLLGQYDSVDMRGTPWIGTLAEGSDFQATIWRPASTLPFVGNPLFPTDKPIILFFDEVTSANTAVMGILYQLVQKRRVGEHIVMPNVRIVLAGNREKDKGIVNRMPLPLCNRLTWFEVIIDVDAWCEHAMAKNWPGVVVAFIQWQKLKLSTFDPDKPQKVFASPRTWEDAIDYYVADMPKSLKHASMVGAIGGVATEFWGFVDVWAKIADLMPRVLKDPAKAPLPDEVSMKYAMAVSISGSLDMKKNNTAPYYTYLKRLPPEFTVLAWQLAVKRDKDLFACDEFIDFGKTYKAIF